MPGEFSLIPKTWKGGRPVGPERFRVNDCLLPRRRIVGLYHIENENIRLVIPTMELAGQDVTALHSSYHGQLFRADNLDKLKKSYLKLRQITDDIDIAFMPIPIPENEEEPDLRAFLQELSTRMIILHDPNRRSELFPDAARRIKSWGFQTEIRYPENAGDLIKLEF